MNQNEVWNEQRFLQANKVWNRLFCITTSCCWVKPIWEKSNLNFLNFKNLYKFLHTAILNKAINQKIELCKERPHLQASELPASGWRRLWSDDLAELCRESYPSLLRCSCTWRRSSERWTPIPHSYLDWS